MSAAAMPISEPASDPEPQLPLVGPATPPTDSRAWKKEIPRLLKTDAVFAEQATPLIKTLHHLKQGGVDVAKLTQAYGARIRDLVGEALQRQESN